MKMNQKTFSIYICKMTNNSRSVWYGDTSAQTVSDIHSARSTSESMGHLLGTENKAPATVVIDLALP